MLVIAAASAAQELLRQCRGLGHRIEMSDIACIAATGAQRPVENFSIEWRAPARPSRRAIARRHFVHAFSNEPRGRRDNPET
jgi:hypothetical protein